MSTFRSVALVILFIGFSLLCGSAAQTRPNQGWRPRDGWLPVDPADLALKDNPASPGSQAMILYRAEYDDSGSASVTHYERIKIFTAEGERYGNIEIPFSKNVASIGALKARTILPSGSVVEFNGKPYVKTVVKARGVKVLEDTFSFPALQPGCIIEYQYRTQRDPSYYWNITAYVQEYLFVREEDFDVKPPTGPGAPALDTLEFDVPQLVNLQKQKDGTYAMSFHDIPALKREPYMPPADSVRGRVEFFYTRASQQTPEKFWDATAKILAKSLDDFINKKGALKKLVAETVGEGDPPLVKLHKLYDRAQQIHNDAVPPIGPEPAKSEKLKNNNNVEDEFHHGYGNGTDINAAFIGLARAAGFDAQWVYIANRTDSVFVPKLEDLKELDDNIVLVRTGGHDLFLDPGSPDYPFGLLPWYEFGDRGLVVSKDGAEIVQIPALTADQAVTERHATLRLDATGSLSGTVEIDFEGIEGSAIRLEERGEGESDRSADVKKIIQDWLPSKANLAITSITGWRHSSAPLRVECTLTVPAYAASVGKRLLAPLEPFVSVEARAFRPADRVNPVEFNHAFEYRDEVTLQLPSGYGVEDLPKPASIHTPPFQYNIAVEKSASALRVTRDLTVDGFYFEAQFYPTIRGIFDKVEAGDSSPAVLERVNAPANR